MLRRPPKARVMAAGGGGDDENDAVSVNGFAPNTIVVSAEDAGAYLLRPVFGSVCGTFTRKRREKRRAAVTYNVAILLDRCQTFLSGGEMNDNHDDANNIGIAAGPSDRCPARGPGQGWQDDAPSPPPTGGEESPRIGIMPNRVYSHWGAVYHPTYYVMTRP